MMLLFSHQTLTHTKKHRERERHYNTHYFSLTDFIPFSQTRIVVKTRNVSEVGDKNDEVMHMKKYSVLEYVLAKKDALFFTLSAISFSSDFLLRAICEP